MAHKVITFDFESHAFEDYARRDVEAEFNLHKILTMDAPTPTRFDRFLHSFDAIIGFLEHWTSIIRDPFSWPAKLRRVATILCPVALPVWFALLLIAPAALYSADAVYTLVNRIHGAITNFDMWWSDPEFASLWDRH